MAPEWLRFGKKKEKEFAPTSTDIGRIVRLFIKESESGMDPDFHKMLLYYNGQDDYHGRFDINFVNKTSVDIVTEGENPRVVANLGVGENDSIYFISKLAKPGWYINKFKKKEEIKNPDELAKTIHDFILEEPKEGDLVDVHKKRWETLMNEGKNEDTNRFDLINKIKSDRLQKK